MRLLRKAVCQGKKACSDPLPCPNFMPFVPDPLISFRVNIAVDRIGGLTEVFNMTRYALKKILRIF